MNLRELIERAYTLLETHAQFGMDATYDDGSETPNAKLSHKTAEELKIVAPAIAELIEAQQAWFVAQGYYDAALTAETTHNAHVQMQQAETRIRAALAKLGGE